MHNFIIAFRITWGVRSLLESIMDLYNTTPSTSTLSVSIVTWNSIQQWIKFVLLKRINAMNNLSLTNSLWWYKSRANFFASELDLTRKNYCSHWRMTCLECGALWVLSSLRKRSCCHLRLNSETYLTTEETNWKTNWTIAKERHDGDRENCAASLAANPNHNKTVNCWNSTLMLSSRFCGGPDENDDDGGDDSEKKS